MFALTLLIVPIASFAADNTSNDFEIIPQSTNQTTVNNAVDAVGGS